MAKPKDPEFVQALIERHFSDIKQTIVEELIVLFQKYPPLAKHRAVRDAIADTCSNAAFKVAEQTVALCVEYERDC
jgi:hypothetical protein